MGNITKAKPKANARKKRKPAKVKSLGEWAYQRGYDQLKVYDVDTFNEEAMRIFGTTTKSSIYYYRTGRVEPKVSQYFALLKLFRRFGITKNIWGQ